MANPTDSTSYSQAIADPLANGWETMADTDTDLAIELLGGEAATPTSRNADRETATVDELRELSDEPTWHRAVPNPKHPIGGCNPDGKYCQHDVPLTAPLAEAALVAERAENARLRSSLASSLTFLGSLIEIHAKVVMDTDADRELHARVVQTFRDALDALAVAPRHEGSGEAT